MSYSENGLDRTVGQYPGHATRIEKRAVRPLRLELLNSVAKAKAGPTRSR